MNFIIDRLKENSTRVALVYVMGHIASALNDGTLDLRGVASIAAMAIVVALTPEGSGQTPPPPAP